MKSHINQNILKKNKQANQTKKKNPKNLAQHAAFKTKSIMAIEKFWWATVNIIASLT
jgi:hypothetical protein